MSMDLSTFFRETTRRCFEAIVFFIPLSALPWTVNPLEINKQTLFYLLAAVCILSWFAYTIIDRSLEVRKTRAWVLLGVWVACVAISSALAADRYTSIVGQGSQEYTSLVTIVFGAGLAFVGAQIFDRVFMRRVLVASLLSAAIVLVLGSLAFFGMSFAVLPTNVIGTPNALAIYGVVMAMVGSAAILVDDHIGKISRMIVYGSTAVVSVVALCMLLTIDYGVLWGIALCGTLAIFGFALLHPSLLLRPARYMIPMVFFVASLFFLALPTMAANPFPSEISLQTVSSLGIVKDVYASGAWAFGTGPGTFAQDFSQFHSADLNATTFWDTRFDRASSGALTSCATLGIFATLAYVALALFVMFRATFAFKKAQHPSDLPMIIGFVVLVCAWLVYPQNMTLVVLSFVFLAGALRTSVPAPSTLAFDRSPRAGFAAALICVLASMFVLTVAFATVSKYRADVAFAQAIALSSGGGNVDDVIVALDHAATANRWSDVYYRNLAFALLEKVIALSKDTTSDPNTVKSLIGAAVNASVRATDLGPKNATNWELRGDVYRAVSPLIADAATFSIGAYQTAVSLAPTNPKYLVDLARAYLAYADVLTPVAQGDDAAKAADAKSAQDSAFATATETFLKAIALKSDYAEARYYLAAAYERQGKLADAVTSMEAVRASSPTDVGVGLQLSLLYLRQGKNDLAKRELERIIALAPNFSNAHWYLASILEQSGDKNGALMELETIMKIDPSNQTVSQKIDALRAGIAAAEVPEPLPTEEAPLLPDASQQATQ